MENDNLTKEERYELAMSMLDGRNSIENMRKGYVLIENLANEGCCFAQYVLGVLLYNETEITEITRWTFSADIFEKDTVKAKSWLEKACKNNDTKILASRMLENIKNT